MMETLNLLMGGFATALSPVNLLWALAGCMLGTAIGVLPGLGPAVTVAMLLPITGQVDVTASMIFFAGIYYGAMYGGSTTSILLNTPGETGSMVTALEGFKMAKSGRAGAALATAAIGSFVAGTIATVLVTLFAPIVAEYAVLLGPPEYFCLMLLAFTTVSAVLGGSTLRGMTSLFLGLAMGLVGIDQITGATRYTGGVLEFMDGIEVVLVAVGLFAVGETLYNALYEGRVVSSLNKMSRVHMTRTEWRRSWPAWIRATFIGFPFGTVPAGGSEIPTFLSYATERKLADPEHRKEFGTTGAIEGVAGPEAANNSAITATLIPLLTLGIPTSVTTAILLNAFQNYGIQAGPQLFDTSSALVWALIASLYIGNIMLLVLNLPLVGLWVKLLKIPKAPLYAGILIFATVGVYGMRQSNFDLFLMLALGLAGVIMRRYDFPIAPAIVGLILGPYAEAHLRNAVSIGEGSFTVFFERPMSAVLIAVVVLVLVTPRVLAWHRRA
jgi:putative tricarboxylic transport membrane protein